MLLAPAVLPGLAAVVQQRARQLVRLLLGELLYLPCRQQAPSPVLLDPVVAPNLATTLLFRYTRRCPEGP